jgi:hypothetical protein
MREDLFEEPDRWSGIAVTVFHDQAVFVFPDWIAMLISRRAERRSKSHTEGEESVGLVRDGVASEKVFDGKGCNGRSETL